MWVATKRTVRERTVTIRFHKQTIFSLSHLEGITQGAGEEVGGASVMGVDTIGEVVAGLGYHHNRSQPVYFP